MLDEEGRDGEAVVEERRVDAALEPLARIAGERERLARPRDRVGREIGAFDDDVGRLGVTLECSPPMMPPMS